MGLMHKPKLLFLDEPSTGMDPQNRANLWEHILALRAESGTTIVLTTHYLEEADAQAERVLVIDHGVIIADDTASRLKANLAGDRITVTVRPNELEKATTAISHRGAEITTGKTALGVTVSARFDRGAEAMPWVLRQLDLAGLDTLAAELKLPTLDDVFLSLTGRSLREEEVAA
jgi:ABC-2 type transport system ATP-binding protein